MHEHVGASERRPGQHPVVGHPDALHLAFACRAPEIHAQDVLSDPRRPLPVGEPEAALQKPKPGGWLICVQSRYLSQRHRKVLTSNPAALALPDALHGLQPLLQRPAPILQRRGTGSRDAHGATSANSGN